MIRGVSRLDKGEGAASVLKTIPLHLRTKRESAGEVLSKYLRPRRTLRTLC